MHNQLKTQIKETMTTITLTTNHIHQYTTTAKQPTSQCRSIITEPRTTASLPSAFAITVEHWHPAIEVVCPPVDVLHSLLHGCCDITLIKDKILSFLFIEPSLFTSFTFFFVFFHFLVIYLFIYFVKKNNKKGKGCWYVFFSFQTLFLYPFCRE